MWRIVTGLAFSLSWVIPASAQADDASRAAKQEIDQQEAPEEIVITGKPSTMQLRIQLMEAERQVYDIFNQFNDDKRFKISCSRSAPTGSRLLRQVCQAEFEIQARRRHAQDYSNSIPSQSLVKDRPPVGSVVPQNLPVEAELQRHQKAYQAKMRQIAEEHPEFLNALVRYSALSQEYKEHTGQE